MRAWFPCAQPPIRVASGPVIWAANCWSVFQLHPCYQQILAHQLFLIDSLNSLTDDATRMITRCIQTNPNPLLLTTVWGNRYYVALLVLAEIGDIQRFLSAKKLCSWAGFVP